MKLVNSLILSFVLTSMLHGQISKPSDLSLKALSSTEVSINWRDNSDSETGYKIFRDGALIKTTMSDVASFKDKNLLPNHTYRYTVKATDDNPNKKSITLQESPKSLKNPLKGFMIWPDDTRSAHKYVTMFKAVINWDNVENSINDGVDKIKAYSEAYLFNDRWYQSKKFNVEDRDIKVNPEIVLKRESYDDFSPSDMDIKEHDNQTKLFGDRVENLVKKLAQAWDNDPRIGFIYMGMVGTWGEQFSTQISPSIAKVLGDSFSRYFKNKKVMVRIPNYFDDWYLKRNNNSFNGQKYTNYYRFGLYWDAFGWKHEDRPEIFDHSAVVNGAKLWVDQPILGEVAFNVGNENIHSISEYDLVWPYNNQKAIHDTLTDPKMLDYLIDYIYSIHATGLSWISMYNKDDKQEAAAAAKLQKAMGYRFVVTDAIYNDIIAPGGKMKIELNVKNVGSAPFYYDWPLQVVLLDKDTKELVYSHKFDNVDIREWLPGDDWDNNKNRYKIAPKSYHVVQEFTLPIDLAKKDYILAIEIDDPAGMKPSVRFANVNYYKDGRMPIAMVGVLEKPSSELPPFDDLDNESQIGYSAKHYESTNNYIFSVSMSTNKDDRVVAFRIKGSYIAGSHIDLYIDADNNSATGYNNGVIRGVDYLIEDGTLYKYPQGANGWQWEKVGSVTVSSSLIENIFTMSYDVIGINAGDKVNITASVTTPDWKTKKQYAKMVSGGIK